MSGCAGWGLAPLASSDEGIGMWSADGSGRMEYVVPAVPKYDVKWTDVQEVGSSEGVLRLDRSTVWAETAVSSRILHMALTRGIGAADSALTWIG